MDDGLTNWETFLVEHYRPGISVDALRRSIESLRSCAAELEREGRDVRYVRSTIVPGDEGFLSVFEAAGDGLVREACLRAGLEDERISAAISVEA
jgi:hypothetical protein